jgi:hypothetical protein
VGRSFSRSSCDPSVVSPADGVCSDFASSKVGVVIVPRMAQRSAAGPPAVEAPAGAADTPSWTRVGVIAAIGFVVGVAWPRLAGVRLGPSLPDGAVAPVAAMSASAMSAAPAPEASSVSGPPTTENAAPPASAATAEPTTGAQGSPAGLKAAQVEWEVALVRDSPKTGKVIARLPRGSQVRVGPVKDGWYPVAYGNGFSSDGWVYRGAIGR